MGIPVTNPPSSTPPVGDLATEVISGAFTAAATQSPTHAFLGSFNVVFFGGPATAWSIQLERSFDAGATWIIAGIGGAGQQGIYASTAGLVLPISFVATEPEMGVTYRLNCTAIGSGSIAYRMSTTGQATRSRPLL